MARDRFVGPPEGGRPIHLYDSTRQEPVREVFWGDYLSVLGEEGEWLKIKWAPRSQAPSEMFIRKAETVDRRPLEVIFVDVGQGDGAVLITPERDARERVVVIDAGRGGHMARFLRGRFRSYHGFQFDAAVITHPDQDHYGGFLPLFLDKRIGFDTVFHNGLVERPVGEKFEKLGGLTKDESTGTQYLEDLAEDHCEISRDFSDNTNFGRRKFPPIMHAALTNERIGRIRMLSTGHGSLENSRSWLPGFAPSDGRDYRIEILGPAVEYDSSRKPRLRRLGAYGKTKNGHSVLLKLKYGGFSVLFGGDLNRKAEEYLLSHYGGVDDYPRRHDGEYEKMIACAAKRFRSDVMKVCHHGSSDGTEAFLRAVHAAAYVVSSGDEEGHVHPRPDLLGRLGKLGRGSAPIILSTELQRSTREVEDQKVVDALLADIGKLAGGTDGQALDSIQRRVKELARTNVEVYGAIYVKTDGERLVIAFRIETDSLKKRWFHFEFQRDDEGLLERV